MARVERRFGGRTGVMPGRDRLAYSPTDRPAGCIVCIAALPGSPGAWRFVPFAPEGPRSSLDHTRVCSPTKVRSCFVFLSLLARRDSLIPLFCYRLLLAIRTMTRITQTRSAHGNERLACISCGDIPRSTCFSRREVSVYVR